MDRVNGPVLGTYVCFVSSAPHGGDAGPLYPAEPKESYLFQLAALVDPHAKAQRRKEEPNDHLAISNDQLAMRSMRRVFRVARTVEYVNDLGLVGGSIGRW